MGATSTGTRPYPLVHGLVLLAAQPYWPSVCSLRRSNPRLPCSSARATTLSAVHPSDMGCVCVYRVSGAWWSGGVKVMCVDLFTYILSSLSTTLERHQYPHLHLYLHPILNLHPNLHLHPFQYLCSYLSLYQCICLCLCMSVCAVRRRDKTN